MITRYYLLGYRPTIQYEEKGVYELVSTLQLGHNPAFKITLSSEEEHNAFVRGLALGLDYEAYKEISEDEFHLLENQVEK